MCIRDSGRNTPPQEVHPSSPVSNRASTTTASVSTINIGCLQAPSDGPPARLKHGRVVAHFQGMVTPVTRTIEANPKRHIVTLGDADLPTRGHPQSRPTTVPARAI